MDGRAVGPEFLFKGLDIAADGPRRNADKKFDKSLPLRPVLWDCNNSIICR